MNLPEYFVYITSVVCSWIVFSSQHRNYLSNCCTVSVFFWCSSICLCVHIRTHTHTILVGYSDVSPGVGTRHLKSPESPDGLNLRTCLYRYARRRDEILDWLFFIFEHFCLPGKQKNVNIIPRTRIIMDLSYIDPSLRVLDYFSKWRKQSSSWYCTWRRYSFACVCWYLSFSLHIYTRTYIDTHTQARMYD